MAMGVFSCCNYIGVIVCSVLSGVIGGLGSGVWRWAFWSFGAFGVLWAIGLQKFLKGDSDTHAATSEGAHPEFRDAFAAFAGKPTAILLVLAFGMFIYVNLGIYLWAPSFLLRMFDGLTLADAAFHAVFWSGVGSIAGLLLTARVADRLVAHRATARFDVTIVGMALCVLTVILIATARTLPMCCLGLLAFGFARGVLECTVYPAMFDVIVPRFRSACTGMAGCWAFLFGSMAPAVLGWMSQRFTLRTGFVSLTAFVSIGAVLLVLARIAFLRRDMENMKL